MGWLDAGPQQRTGIEPFKSCQEGLGSIHVQNHDGSVLDRETDLKPSASSHARVPEHVPSVRLCRRNIGVMVKHIVLQQLRL